MSVRVQICYSVALSSKHESKEMICTRSDVAKKQERVEGSGTTWICTSLTTTLPALGGMDAAGVAGQESSYRKRCGTGGHSLSRNSASKFGGALCGGTYTYTPYGEHTFTRHSSAIASHTTCSVKCMQLAVRTANESRPKTEAGH